MATTKPRKRAPRAADDDVRFDAARCVLVPVHADAAVLELTGAFHASAKRALGRPRLVVSSGDRHVEVRALHADAVRAGPDPQPWAASFAVPRDVTERPESTYALAIGRSLRLPLPAPITEPPVDEIRPVPEPVASNGHAPDPEPEVDPEDLVKAEAVIGELEDELAELRRALLRAEEELEDLRLPDAPVAAPRPSPTLSGDALYKVALAQLHSQRRPARRRWALRLFAVIVLLLVGAAIYLVVTGGDLVQIA